MKKLENKTVDNRREMEMLDALEELKEITGKQNAVGVEGALENIIFETEERELIINFIKEINKTKANLEIVKQKIYASQIN